jgi:hypothetical protein
MTPNQIVAYNLSRARRLHGWTQEAAAEHLEPFLGERWSRIVFSAAERSVTGKRIRQFTADEITAFAAAFELPIPFFFMPPRNADEISNRDAAMGLTADAIAELATGPIEASISAVQARFAEDLEALGIRVTREDRVAVSPLTSSNPGDRPGRRGKE